MHITLYIVTWVLIFQNKVWAFSLKIWFQNHKIEIGLVWNWKQIFVKTYFWEGLLDKLKKINSLWNFNKDKQFNQLKLFIFTFQNLKKIRMLQEVPAWSFWPAPVCCRCSCWWKFWGAGSSGSYERNFRPYDFFTYLSGVGEGAVSAFHFNPSKI
jgi:hypothetical protein